VWTCWFVIDPRPYQAERDKGSSGGSPRRARSSCSLSPSRERSIEAPGASRDSQEDFDTRTRERACPRPTSRPTRRARFALETSSSHTV